MALSTVVSLEHDDAIAHLEVTPGVHLLDHPHSLMAAMADWSEIGLFTGQRLGEWAQPAVNYSISNPSRSAREEEPTEQTKAHLTGENLPC